MFYYFHFFGRFSIEISTLMQSQKSLFRPGCSWVSSRLRQGQPPNVGSTTIPIAMYEALAKYIRNRQEVRTPLAWSVLTQIAIGTSTTSSAALKHPPRKRSPDLFANHQHNFQTSKLLNIQIEHPSGFFFLTFIYPAFLMGLLTLNHLRGFLILVNNISLLCSSLYLLKYCYKYYRCSAPFLPTIP